MNRCSWTNNKGDIDQTWQRTSSHTSADVGKSDGESHRCQDEPLLLVKQRLRCLSFFVWERLSAKEMRLETWGERLEICTFIHMQAHLDVRVRAAYMVGRQSWQNTKQDTLWQSNFRVSCSYVYLHTGKVQHSFRILKLRPLEVLFQLEEPEPRFPHKVPELQNTCKRALCYY